jgi:polysaccharide export outer membrane protein
MQKLSIVTVLLFILACVVPVCAAQSNPQPAQSPQEANAPTKPNQPTADAQPELHKRNPRYRIEADDIMELSFRYTPEFDQEVTVQPDGFIQLKGLPGDLRVQGLTVPELIVELKRVYGSVLNDPVISVVLREFEKPYFIAGGQVGKPGKYDLRGDTTAGQAIAIAGGFADYAKNSQVLLFRRYSDDMVEVKVYDLKKIMKGKNVREDPMLQPGDMLFVPKTWMANIDRFLPRSSLGTYFSPAFL